MSEQILINIVRPDVGIEYHAASPEAEIADRLAASELALHALAQHICELRTTMGLPCPAEVSALINSNSWQRGM